MVTTSDGGGYNAVAQAAVDKAQAVIDSLKFEEEQLGRTALQQAIYNNLKAAGVTAESALGQQIVENTTKLEEHRTAIDETAAAMQQFGDIGKSAVRGLIDDLTSGKSAAEAFGNVLNKLGDKLLDVGLSSLFEGGTSGGGLLGSLFNLPGHASGTANTGGVRGRVAGVVHGQEAVIPLPSGGKVPVRVIGPPEPVKGMSGGSAGTTISMPITIDATGADAAAIGRLQAQLTSLKAELPSRVVAAVRTAKSTGNLK